MYASINLGMGLVIAGLIFVLLVWALLQLLLRPTLTEQSENPPAPDFAEAAQSTEALLVIDPGGRVDYLNPLARQYFGLRQDDPADLERLTRRARPADDFLEICAVPGQKRLSINGRLVEVTSYAVPGARRQMLVSLRGLDLSAAGMAEPEASSSLLRVMADFGQSVSSSLELEAVLRSILENVERLISADILEIKVWDAEARAYIPYGFQQADGMGRKLVRLTQSQFGDLSAQVLEQRAALLLEDARATTVESGGGSLPMRAYLGLPLAAGGEIVGVVEIGQVSMAGLSQREMELLGLVSGQAALALRNALLHEQERRRTLELSGLADLAQAVSAIREPQELFARLVGSLAPLLGMEIVGFLLYDENTRRLEGQVPFEGLPPHIVEMYRASVPSNSPAEALLRSQQPILTLNAAEDENWRALGLTNVALAASLKDSALMPLVYEGRVIGYLQASHHRRAAAAFTDSELRLMRIAADQAAAIIENAVLLDHTRRRARRAEVVRRISELSFSALKSGEMLRLSTQELVNLLNADAGAVFLLDEGRGELRLQSESLVGAHIDLPPLGMESPAYRQTATGTHRAFLSGRLSIDRRPISFYHPWGSALNMESVLSVPLKVYEKTFGEWLLASRKIEAFDEYDLQVAATAAGQVAAALERARLASQSDAALQQQVEHLGTVARLSRELSASLDPDYLLNVIHEEMLRATHAECGSVFFLDPEAPPTEPRLLRWVGCPYMGTLSPLERSVIASGQAQLIPDFGRTGFFPPHEGVRCALLVPILYQQRVSGLIQLHAARPASLKEEDAEATRALATQAAVALHNAYTYSQQQQQLERLSRRARVLDRFSATHAAIRLDQPLEEALQQIALGLREATAFQIVLISLYEAESGLLRRVTGVGIPQETLNELLTRKQPLSAVQALLRPEFKIGRSYFIPADQRPVLPPEVHYMYAPEYASPQDAQNAWNADDFLLIPLEDAQGKPLGLISVDQPSNGLRPDHLVIEALELFAAQAVQIISRAVRFHELESRLESLSAGLERQQRLLSVTQTDLPVMLRKDLEQTLALHHLERRAQRVRAGLAIMEMVSRQLDASSALLTLGRETLTQLSMSVALVAENAPDGPRLLHVLGAVPRSANPQALFGQRNPLRAVLQSGKPILIPNLDENDEWREAPLMSQMHTQSAFCLPITVEGRVIAAMLALSPEPMPALSEEDYQVYHQIARQTSVVLQNISLLNETRRRLQEVNLLLEFSRRLSGLDPLQIVEALLESGRRVLSAAHAGVVLLWNGQNHLLETRAASGYVDNESMLRITYRAGEALPGAVFAARTPRRVDEVNFARDYALSAEHLAAYRQGTGGRLPVSSMLIPILAGEQTLGLLVVDNFNTPAAFKAEDETLMISLAQQAGLSLENVRLVHATGERAAQLQALNEVATAMTSSLRSEELIASLLDRLALLLPFDTATLWLRDQERLTVAAARGFSDNEKRLGLTVAVADSALFKEMVKSGQPISVADVREDPRFPPVEVPCLSWLGIPMISKGELIGVVALEKWQARFYTQEQIQLATTFASQAAVALDHARLYEESLRRASELDERSQRLAFLYHFSSSLSGLLDAGQILELTARELHRALNAQRVSAVLMEPRQARWVAAWPRVRQNLPQLLPEAPVFARLRESLGIFNTAQISSEPDLLPLMDFLGEETGALLIVPLASGQELRALLFAHSASGHFGLTEVELARTIANQAAIALENARLYQSTLQTAERFAILNRASAEIGSSLKAEDIYVSIHKAAERLMPVEAFVISLLNEEKNEVDGVYLVDQGQRLPEVHMPLGQGLSSRVITSGAPLLLHSSEAANALGAVPVGEGGTPLSILAVPMTLGPKTLGMLSVQSYQPNAYTEEDVQILSTLANQAIVAIQNGRLFAETQRLAQELEQRVLERTAQLQREQQNTETLLRILTEVSSSLDLDRALHRTLSLLNETLGAEQGTIMLLHAEDNLLHYRAGYGYLSERAAESSPAFTLKVGEGLAGWVVQNREAVLVEDLLQDPRWVKAPSSSANHRSAIAAPLLVAEDVIGVLLVFHRAERYFTPDSLNLVKAIASQVAVAINNAHLYELIRDQAERLGSMLRKEQEETSRSQAILEAVADGVLVTGPDNRITFINASIERILDIRADRVLGQSLEDFVGLFGRAAATWMQTIRQWSQTPTSYQPGETYAEQIELGDGRIVLVHLAPVFLQNDFLGTVSIFRDITHEVEVDRLKSEFVATVSHELRTPMTSIKGYVDILLMGAAGALNENQLHFLHIVKNNIDRLNILVDDLLDISRIEAGRVTLSPQPIDVREIAEEIVAELTRRSREERKPMEIALDVPPNLPPVYGDAGRVRQILENLVDNAYHYTPENGLIKVRMFALNENEVEVDVIDTGVGIPPEEQERVFERFYRGEHPFVLATPGTGLGLSIVKQLVEMHNGRIWMASEGIPGRGCTFSFTLPIYETQSA